MAAVGGGVVVMFFIVCLAASVEPVLAQSAPPVARGLPSATVPDGLGVNIHFAGAPAKRLDLIRNAGFRVVRMDLTWSSVERKKGIYDFTAYDELTRGLEERGIRPLYILDYANPLYDAAVSIRTDAGRRAFARFAAAAAARYRGHGVIWEIWNEPNGRFWKPHPSAREYMQLVRAAVPAIRRADPHATIIAPAAEGVPLSFLRKCFQDGLLSMVNAVSIHPYRMGRPETLVSNVRQLRKVMEEYSPAGSSVPIVVSEWGYPTFPLLYGPAKQGDYLAREFLVEMSLGIRLSIWYDFHDDGTNRLNIEDNFGTLTHAYRPKPAYEQMQRLVAALGGLHFVKRLPSKAQDWLLLFEGPGGSEIAAWTTGLAHRASISQGHSARLTGAPSYIPVSAASADRGA